MVDDVTLSIVKVILSEQRLHVLGRLTQKRKNRGVPQETPRLIVPGECQLQVTVTVGYALGLLWLASTTVPLPLAMLQVMPPGSVMVVPPPPKVT